MRQAVLGGDAPPLAESDSRVVDDRIERSQRVGCLGQPTGLRDAGEVANEDAGRAGHRVQRRPAPRRIAGVQHNLVPLPDQQLRGHAAQAVRGPGDEDARHAAVLLQ